MRHSGFQRLMQSDLSRTTGAVQYSRHSRSALRMSRGRPTLDPVISLQVPADKSGASQSEEGVPGSRSLVSSVCFIPPSNVNSSHDWQSESESSQDESESFRCRHLVRQEKRYDGDVTASARDAAASLSLEATRLASCHANGDAFLWDLGRRRIVANFGGDDDDERRGPGMALRRMDVSSNKIMYHTRDAHGTVSIHDIQKNEMLTKFETHSFSFCAAAPCAGNTSLIVIPTEHNCHAAVRDIRISPESPPVVRLHGAGLEEATLTDQEGRGHGMLTSVAMSEANNGCGRPVVVCGMESGTIFFHDLLMPGRSPYSMEAQVASKLKLCHIQLGDDPVLGIDLVASTSSSTDRRSFVAIAGLAGDAADLSGLPAEERGRVGVVKATFGGTESTPTATARLRTRVSTCEIGGPDDSFRGGKPGVGLCRFRPDGRMFAVGGWDRRVRIFDRTGEAAPLAILKGHNASVTAVDWAPNSQSTGFLATGAGDGRISIWRCFPS